MHGGATTVPTGLSDVIAIAAGGRMVQLTDPRPDDDDEENYADHVVRDYSVALRKDGRLVAWGAGVPRGLPASLPRGASRLYADSSRVVALDKQGRALTWGVDTAVPRARGTSERWPSVRATRSP